MRRVYGVGAGVVALGMWCAAGYGDEVVLKDGSHLVGEVQQYFNGKLKVKTDFAGEVTVEAGKVKTIQSAAPMAVQFKSGDRSVGALGVDGAGNQVVAGEQERAFGLDQVTAIWPQTQDSPELTEAKAKLASSRWKVRLELGLNGETGTNERVAFNGRIEANKKTDVDRLKLFAQGRYAQDQGVDQTRQIIGGARYEYDIDKSWYLFGTLELENNKFEHLDLRTTVAAGLGYFVVRETDLEFKLHAGPGFQYEAFDDGTHKSSAVLELGEDVLWKVQPWLNFTHFINYYPTFDDLQDYRLVMENAGEIPISPDQTWKIRIGMRNQYKSQPVSGTEKLDTTYFLNLVWDMN